MSDDRSRDVGGPVRAGNVGPADPHADPATDPSLRAVTPAAPSGAPTVPVPADPTGGPTVPVRTEPAPPAPVGRSRMSGLWIGLIGSALVLLLLLIFILQNLDPVAIHFLGAEGRLPAGVALLFAAIAGVLLVAIPGSLRILHSLGRSPGRRGNGALTC